MLQEHELQLNDVKITPTITNIIPKSPITGIFCLKYANSRIDSKITLERE